MLVKQKVIGVFEKLQKHAYKARNRIWRRHSRPGHSHLISILPVKMVELPQQHANVIVHWLQVLPLPIAAKSSIFNVVEFLDLFLKTSPCMKTSLVSCENQSFFLLFRNVATFIESHCVFLCCSLQYDEVFLIRLLEGSCLSYFYWSSQLLFKVKITFKRVI